MNVASDRYERLSDAEKADLFLAVLQELVSSQITLRFASSVHANAARTG